MIGLDEDRFSQIFKPQSQSDLEMIARAKADASSGKQPQSLDVVYVDAYNDAIATQEMINTAHEQIQEVL